MDQPLFNSHVRVKLASEQIALLETVREHLLTEYDKTDLTPAQRVNVLSELRKGADSIALIAGITTPKEAAD